MMTAPGEVLLIYQMSGLTLNTVCDGMSVYPSSNLSPSAEYAVAPGSAQNCTHAITKVTSYSSRMYL